LQPRPALAVGGRAGHNRQRMSASLLTFVAASAALLAGCAARAPYAVAEVDVTRLSCAQLVEQLDRVQRRAADVAYAVDARAGRDIDALGIGVRVFWPALLALQPDGAEARELNALQRRDGALRRAATAAACPPPAVGPLAVLPVAAGDRLVYGERASPRAPAREVVLRIAAVRGDRIDFAVQGDGSRWQQDLAGNVSGPAPAGRLSWRRLLDGELALGQVVAGELLDGSDVAVRARARGQVVAIGPQTIGGRTFDVAVIELFGDVLRNDAVIRLDGVLAVDRASGVVTRLDLRSADPGFTLRRELWRVER
jgi:hypothetical protein